MQVAATAAVGAWALGAHRIARLRGRALWIATIVAYSIVVLNVVVASVLTARFDWPFPRLHMPYEFSGIVAIAIVYSYGNQLKARRYLIYGCGGLFLMGLALRALFMS